MGFGGRFVCGGDGTFDDGLLRVDEDHGDGRHVQVWAPAAIVAMALHVIPRHRLEHAAANARPWLPMFRALTKELEKYPEAELVEVRNANQHVRIRTHNGKLLIDVTEPGENFHVVYPLMLMDDSASELEA